MAVINKGISKAVKEEFINGTHHPDAMLTKLAHLNTDDNRRAYIVGLTKALREKYGMETKRDKRFGKSRKKPSVKKPTVQPTTQKPIGQQIAESLFGAGLIGQKKYTGFNGDGENTPYEDSKYFVPQRISDEDKIIEEYIKKDDELRALQMKYDDLSDGVAELKREIARLQVIISYLEGRK
jgi:hypothetical protein